MIITVTITGSQLLKYIHITKLKIIMLVDLISKTNKKTILIKIIIDNLFTEVDKYFIVYNKRECSWLKVFITQWKL